MSSSQSIKTEQKKPTCCFTNPMNSGASEIEFAHALEGDGVMIAHQRAAHVRKQRAGMRVAQVRGADHEQLVRLANRVAHHVVERHAVLESDQHLETHGVHRHAGGEGWDRMRGSGDE